MANELDYDKGVSATLIFSLANPAASAATAGLLAQGNSGLAVPTGYEFHPLLIQISSNADLTAGTATAQVTSGGTVLPRGPSAALSDTVQQAAGVARVGADPVVAGALIGVKVTTNGAYAPVTADLDVVVTGVYLPA